MQLRSHLVTLEEADLTTTLGVYSSGILARDAIRRYMLKESIVTCPILPDNNENYDGGDYFNIAVYRINKDEF